MAADSKTRGGSTWSRARALAVKTPETRNRYVDFLRAASIAVVVLGHWSMAAPYIEGGKLKLGDLLHMEPWSQWLTWIFQVMPLFFLVGGYANAASWERARQSGQTYEAWASTRLKRLVGPVVPLLILWTVMGVAAHRLGVEPPLIQTGSRVAFIPTWFLAVYVMVVAAAPGTYWLWRRFGMASFWALAFGAAVVDAVGLWGGFHLIRWANYAFVWVGVHHLGYMWRDGRLTGRARALPWALGGLGVLIFLVKAGPYPLSMITVPGDEVSNSRPPTLALLALGAMHGGFAVAVEAPARRWLRRLWPWTATVLVNGTIMTLYLWHFTVMILMTGLANRFGGIGLGFYPGTPSWWVTRPVWVAILAAVLSIFITIFGRFEQIARGEAAVTLPAWRIVTGAIAVCYGLAVLTLFGIWAEGLLGVRLWSVIVALAGAALVLWSPKRRMTAA